MPKFLTTGHRIILLYTAITLCAIGMVAAVLWYWVSDYGSDLYYSYLEERAELIAHENLERFNDNKLYDSYMRHRSEDAAKPFATQIVLDADARNFAATRRALSRYLTDDQISRLTREGEVRFNHNESLGVALYCPKQEGFIVLVTLNGHLGDYLYLHLGYWLLAVAGLCVVLVTLVSKLYTLRHIRTLNEAYQRERQFVHHASHELNNPLTAIQGECEITLLKPRTTEEYTDSLGRIGQEARRMTLIIRQLLSLSSAMDGTDGEEKEPVNWAELLRPLCDGYERVTLTVEPGAADGATVMANPYLLKMAVNNILRNALKYSTAPVRVTLADHRLTVADEGVGIPKADMPYILQPFYRASNTRQYEGHGVGMSLASSILRLYHIVLDVRSREGIGTTVELRWK